MKATLLSLQICSSLLLIPMALLRWKVFSLSLGSMPVIKHLLDFSFIEAISCLYLSMISSLAAFLWNVSFDPTHAIRQDSLSTLLCFMVSVIREILAPGDT